jgi:hypothetical protein
MITHDLSTLNVAELHKLPVATLPAPLHLQTDPGNGCAGDPPGFPTYFTRGVYTPNGNTPSHGPEQVISHGGKLYVTRAAEDWKPGDTWDKVYARCQALMRRLYVPLAFDHPRVQAWVAATHQHLAHCYVDDEGAAEKPEGVRSHQGVQRERP